MKLHEKARCWTVRYSRPKTVEYVNADPRTYQYNYCANVIALSAVTAITETVLAYPDATIVSVNPGPGGEVIISRGSLLAGIETKEHT